MYKLQLKHKYGEVNDILIHNNQFYSLRLIILSSMLFADWCDESDKNSLYFPYFLDWRGRLYTLTSYLTLQGGSLARSLWLLKKDQYLCFCNKRPSGLCLCP